MKCVRYISICAVAVQRVHIRQEISAHMFNTVQSILLNNKELGMRSESRIIMDKDACLTVFDSCKFTLQHESFNEGRLNEIKRHLKEMWAENRDTVSTLFMLKFVG